MQIDSGVSFSEIKIGNKSNQASISIKSGASSFKISIPKNAAIKVTNNSGLSSNNFEKAGLQKDGSIYQSKNYGTATQKIDLVFETGASSIDLEQY